MVVTKQSLLLVYTRGGAPLEFALPSMARVAQVHVLPVTNLPEHTGALWEQHVTTILAAPDPGEDLTESIVQAAKSVDADAVTTLSEFALLGVAVAAQRLGLKGPGPNVALARDKRQMRAAWERAGVPSPRFRQVRTRVEYEQALDELTLPVLLKAAWGAGSVAQTIVSTKDSAQRAWSEATAALEAADAAGFHELTAAATTRDLLVEEVIQGTTEGWFPEGSGYGDYLSVEGIVDQGTYHPLCITTRIPTIPPFTELSNLAPADMPVGLQRRIEAVARQAVDALRLQTCGTHTEMKLCANGEVKMIETAARLGGVNVARQLEAVFGLNPIEMLVRALLGQRVEYPPAMLTEGNGASGSLSIIATDAHGTPWTRTGVVWDATTVQWDGLISEGTTIEAVPGLTIPDGTPMPTYGTANGARDYAGLFYLRATSAAVLVKDSYAVLNGLEHAIGGQE